MGRRRRFQRIRFRPITFVSGAVKDSVVGSTGIGAVKDSGTGSAGIRATEYRAVVSANMGAVEDRVIAVQ